MADEFTTVTVTLETPPEITGVDRLNRDRAFNQTRARETFGCGCSDHMRLYRDLVWHGKQSPADIRFDDSWSDAWEKAFDRDAP